MGAADSCRKSRTPQIFVTKRRKPTDFAETRLLGLRKWGEKLAGNFVLKVQTPSISAPLDCFAQSHFTRTSP